MVHFDGCPDWETVEERLCEALDRLGRSDVVVARQQVSSTEQVEARATGMPAIDCGGNRERVSDRKRGRAMDEDLESLDREALIAEVQRLRAGIRAHRDSSGHDLCWHHPQLWGLLPEPVEPDVAVPPWPRFMRGCAAYRESLDHELAGAPVHDVEHDEAP